MNSLIQWPSHKYWTKAYNPVVGCKKVSEGCQNCYAQGVVERFGINNGDFTPTVNPNAKALKKGVVFVGNMTDLFGEWNDPLQIQYWLSHLSYTSTNLVLTKRADRMAKMLSGINPMCNAWWGVTAENQERFNERMNPFLGIIAHKWLSLEPLLDDINLEYRGDCYCPVCEKYFDNPSAWLSPCCGVETNGGEDYNCHECGKTFDASEEVMRCPHCQNGWSDNDPYALGGLAKADDNPLKNVGWVVVGAESGANRRPCKIEWIESIVQQCQDADVPVFVKQIELDGKLVKDINQFPEHLRIRQVPWAKQEAKESEAKSE